MEDYTITLVHIDDIRIGDSVLCPDGRIRTVCRNNIKSSIFMGTTLFGDSYKLGTEPVKKVTFKRN